jgi:hypothetical protein
MRQNILSILFAATVIVAVFAIRGCVTAHKAIDQAMANGAHQSDTVAQHWYDRWKTEHSEKVAIQGTLQAVELTNMAQLDEATKRVQIQRRQIEGLQKVVATVKGRFTTTVIRDTDRVYIAYQDSTISAMATLTGDSVNVDYDVTVPIYLTQYWRRKWLFGRKTHYVDGYSSNPNAHITNLQSVRINAKEPGRFGVGPYVGVNYDRGFKPSIGICLTYSLIRF